MLKVETWANVGKRLNRMHSFLCLDCLPEIYFCVEIYFPSVIKQKLYVSLCLYVIEHS